MWKTLPETVQAKEPFFYAALRVTAITFAGIKENRLLNRAAVLSFSSLIGLIPMIAIIILVSSFALEKSDPDLVINNIRKSISYIAPHLSGLDTDGSESTGEEGENMLWDQLSQTFRESISLLMFSKFCRRFRDCHNALGCKELAKI